MTENQINNICNFSILLLHINVLVTEKDYILNKWYNIIDPNKDLVLNTEKNQQLLDHRIITLFRHDYLNSDPKEKAIVSLIVDMLRFFGDKKRPTTLDNMIETFRFYVDLDKINDEITDWALHPNLIEYRNVLLTDPINSRTYNLEIFTD